jgi:hypothetical protein
VDDPAAPPLPALPPLAAPLEPPCDDPATPAVPALPPLAVVPALPLEPPLAESSELLHAANSPVDATVARIPN